MQRVDGNDAGTLMCSEFQQPGKVGEIAYAPIAPGTHGKQGSGESPCPIVAGDRLGLIAAIGNQNKRHRSAEGFTLEFEAVVAGRRQFGKGKAAADPGHAVELAPLYQFEIRGAQRAFAVLPGFGNQAPAHGLLGPGIREGEVDCQLRLIGASHLHGRQVLPPSRRLRRFERLANGLLVAQTIV